MNVIGKYILVVVCLVDREIYPLRKCSMRALQEESSRRDLFFGERKCECRKWAFCQNMAIGFGCVLCMVKVRKVTGHTADISILPLGPMNIDSIFNKNKTRN